jgi:uncharacterized membrane protein
MATAGVLTTQQVRDRAIGAEAVAARLPSLDAMRGLIMVLMAIDHARGFIAKNHPGEFWGRGLPDYGGDAIAFLTRLVTHLCAPGFMFLMGAGMALFAVSRARLGWSSARVVRHFVVRGLALVLLGQVLENGAVVFGLISATHIESYGLRPPGADGTLPFLIFPVLYGLGSALVISAPFARLAPRILCLLAAACVVVTLWITPGASQADVPFNPVMRLLFLPGQTGHMMVIYSTFAWLTPVFLGIAFGKWLLHDRSKAFNWLAFTGAAFLATFVVIRLAGGFGDLDRTGPGWIGVLNVVKYPPSLTFLLLTLGVDFLLLAALDRAHVGRADWSRPFLVFGTVPFFFFVTHMWLYAAMGRFFPAGIGIPQMYAFWLLGLVLLYVPCRWYGDFKSRLSPDSFLRML